MDGPGLAALAGRLAEAGCVAPWEEAVELADAADGDGAALAAFVARRERGEPLAWITGSVVFAGHRVLVRPGVYVPRWETETLARRAVELLPVDGAAVDLCTGSGAVAVVLGRSRPAARVVATDIDPVACRCARANGVDVTMGDLADVVPAELRGRVDVVTAVVPYVPTAEIVHLPRDVQAYEPRRALDGGPGGTEVLARAVTAAAGLLRPGGTVLLELGGDQDTLLATVLRRAGFDAVRSTSDADGDLRCVEATLASRPPPAPA
jgi:release factor glutamine methyltransferase